MKVGYVFTLALLGFRYCVLHKNSFTAKVREPVPMKHQYQMPRINNVNGHLYKKELNPENLKAKTFTLFLIILYHFAFYNKLNLLL
jgi:hypothetical protein